MEGRSRLEEMTMWFEQGFDKRLQVFILSNPLPNATLDCFTESFRYAERLIAAGFSPLLCEGFYLGDGAPVEHYWLYVRGRIFDPTSAQFWSVAHADFFEVSNYWNESAITDHLPYVERPEMFEGKAEQIHWSRCVKEACGICLA